MTVGFRLLTPPIAGAIAIVQVEGTPSDIDSATAAMGLAPIPAGRSRLGDLLGVDRALATRWTPGCLHLTPHGGAAIVRRLLAALAAAGLEPRSDDDPTRTYPEARDAVEACMLAALATAASPGAIDRLLDGAEHWRRWNGASPPRDDVDRVSQALRRLINPPLVAAVGAANVGKSTLLNAMAGRDVAIVADEPGSTRDHVGAHVELHDDRLGEGCFIIRWIDTPGLREASRAHPLELEAINLARAVIASADLVLLVGDAASGFADLHAHAIEPRHPPLRVAARADLGVAPGADVVTAASRRDGLDSLSSALVDRLLTPEALAWNGPWRFHDRLPAPAPGGSGGRN